MVYLCLAVFMSALVSVMMRFGEGRIQNNMGMFVVNYAISILFARIYMGKIELFTKETGIGISVGLGIMAGILYLVNFVLLQKNIRLNGMMLASTFMKLGVIIPTLMAMTVFHEEPRLTQILGILLALFAIVMINFEKGDGAEAKYKFMLILMLLCGGITDSLANIFDKLGNHALEGHYLFCTFLAAFLCAVFMCIRTHKKISLWDMIFGVLIGIPNYYSSRFLLASLSRVPAVIVYPVYSVGTIVTVSVVSIFLFKESLSKQKAAAVGIIFAALILLNAG